MYAIYGTISFQSATRGLKGEENREGPSTPVNVITSRTERRGKMQRTEAVWYMSTPLSSSDSNA